MAKELNYSELKQKFIQFCALIAKSKGIPGYRDLKQAWHIGYNDHSTAIFWVGRKGTPVCDVETFKELRRDYENH